MTQTITRNGMTPSTYQLRVKLFILNLWCFFLIACFAMTSKYRNIPTFRDNIRFASKREAERYTVLKALLQAGKIQDLRLQVPYVLRVNGQIVAKYIADFQYFDLEIGKTIMEDSKGFSTREYRIKKKLVKAIYDMDIVET